MLMLSGHQSVVRSVAYSPDGTHLVSAAHDGTVRVWSLASGHDVKSIGFRGLEFDCAVFAPDGRFVACGGSDAIVRMWNWRTGEVHALGDASGRVACLGFSPCEPVLYSGSRGHADVPAGGVLAAWALDRRGWLSATRPARSVRCVACSRENILAWAGDGATFGITHAVTHRGSGEASFRDEAPGPVRSMGFSPDGTLLAMAAGNQVCLFKLEHRALATPFGPVNAPLRAIACSPCGRRLLAGGDDGLVRLYDAASGRQLDAFDWKIGRIRSVCFAPDGMTAAACGRRDILVWDVG